MIDSVGTLEKSITLDSCGDIFSFCDRVTEVNGYSNGYRKANSINTDNSTLYEQGL